MIYQGADSQLILQAGDTYTVEPNGLRTLTRTFACATSYANATVNTIPAIGASASGYSGMSLFTLTRSDADGVTRLTCIYHGESGASRVSKSQTVRSLDATLTVGNGTENVSASYYSPTYTVEKALEKDNDTISTPSVSTITDGAGVVEFVKIVSLYFDNYTLNDALSFSVTPVSVSRTNYGAVDVLIKTFTVTTPYG